MKVSYADAIYYYDINDEAKCSQKIKFRFGFGPGKVSHLIKLAIK